MDSNYQIPLESLDENDMYSQQWDVKGDRCNLIINYLPQDINDITLRTLFAQFGEISQAKVVRDKISKKSLGYGFVKFVEDDDAQAAVMQMNGFPLGHKKLKVSIARLPSEEIRNCKLYVTNLPRTYNEYDVAGLFSQFGDIIECRVLKDKQSGMNKGVAFIQFNVRGEANRAMSLNGQRLEGVDRPLIVKYAEDQHKKKEKRPLPPHMPGRYRADAPYLFPVDQLPPSNVVGSKMVYGNTSGVQSFPPGGNMNFPNQMKYGNPNPIPGRNVEWFGQIPQIGYDGLPMVPQNPGINYENPEIDMFGQQRPPSNLFMTNPRGAQDAGYNTNVTLVVSRLPPSFDVPTIQDLFSPYGRILGAHIDAEEYIQADGRYSVPSGRAYIQMETLSQAQNAVQALNGLNSFQREGLGPLQVDIVLNNGVPQRTTKLVS